MKLKTLKDALEIADMHPDKVSRRRDGRFNVRSGFFYRGGRTAEGWAKKVEAALKAVGFKVEVDAREEWAAWPKTSYFNAIVRVVDEPKLACPKCGSTERLGNTRVCPCGTTVVPPNKSHAIPAESVSKDWVCTSCGHEVLSREYPTPIPWSDGHKCRFTERPRVAVKG